MPEMDGVTATRRIHDLDGDISQIPIIALTDNEMKGDEDTYRAASMNDYVSKPIESEKLAAAMQRQSGAEISTGTTNAHSTAPSPGRPNDDGTALQGDLNRLIGNIDSDIACTFNSAFSAIPKGLSRLRQTAANTRLCLAPTPPRPYVLNNSED